MEPLTGSSVRELFEITSKLNFSTQTIESALHHCLAAQCRPFSKKYLDVVCAVDIAQKLHEATLVHVSVFCDY